MVGSTQVTGTTPTDDSMILYKMVPMAVGLRLLVALMLLGIASKHRVRRNVERISKRVALTHVVELVMPEQDR